MRYILYFLTLCLVFTSGMLVGNFYIPTTNETLAAAVSVPDLDKTNPIIDQLTLQQTQDYLQALTQALSSCPVVEAEEKDRLSNQINLFLTIQDFKIKKSAYETEIAKNVQETQTTSKFLRAAQNYSDSKQLAEELANTLFPIPEEEIPVAEPAQSSTQTIVSTEIDSKKSAETETVVSTDTVKN